MHRIDLIDDMSSRRKLPYVIKREKRIGFSKTHISGLRLLKTVVVLCDVTLQGNGFKAARVEVLNFRQVSCNSV